MKKLLTLLAILLTTLAVSAQLTIVVNNIPANTPIGDDIYITGGFQGWDPGGTVMTDNMNGTREITINPPTGIMEYKFTRGSWTTVEGNANGGFLPNRTYNYTGAPATINVDILTWEDVGGTNSTAAANVAIIDEDFFIPQLNRNRRVWIYLPPDYDSSQKDYPVLYMHDGQNVFDAATSFSGEWEVDESLNDLHTSGDYGCIVVAIDNGGVHRLDEYSPWVNPTYGGGEGDEYMAFLVNTLKPYIDANYRTFPGREYTGLMGSSMGGLISHYGGIEYQNTFSKLGIFSPSYWFSDECYTHVSTNGHQAPFRIYTIAGALEGSLMTDGVTAMASTFQNNGFSPTELQTIIHPDGQHSEWYWAREFPDAYEWLFGDLVFTSTENIKERQLTTYPNPASTYIQLEGLNLNVSGTYEIISIDGKVLQSGEIFSQQINISALSEGMYALKILTNDNGFHMSRFVITRLP
ncbi:MAG: alpha/beta hydrolase-fold protein [Bacteroidota bacterium]